MTKANRQVAAPDALAQWREEAIKHRDRLFMLAYGDGPEPEVSVERDELEAVGDVLTAMIGHLAAMPEPDVNAELLGALKSTRSHTGHFVACPNIFTGESESCTYPRCVAGRDAIAAAETGAAG